MGTIVNIVLAVLMPIAFIVAFVVIVFRRGFQMKQLLADGIETTGTVLYTRRHHGDAFKTYHLKYEYTDQHGVSHRHRSMVERSVYREYEEDSSIPIIYSESKPKVSAPKYLVEQVRQAKEKKRVR